MKRMFDFHCKSCGDEFEKLVDTNIRTVTCECGGEASRMISTPTIGLDGTNPDFPTAYDKWANVREQRARVTAKRNRE